MLKNTLANLVSILHVGVVVVILMNAGLLLVAECRYCAPFAIGFNLIVLISQAICNFCCPLTILERKLRGDAQIYTPFLITRSEQWFGWKLNKSYVNAVQYFVLLAPILIGLFK